MEAASRSSDDDSSQASSSSSSSSSSVNSSNPKEHVMIAASRRQESSSDSESESDSKADSSDSDDDSESDDNDDKDEIIENENEASMPLGERIRQEQQQREQRGLDMTEKRARQEEARKIASERVGRRAKKNTPGQDNDDDDDDDEEKAAKKPPKLKKEMTAVTATSRKGKSKHAPTEVSSKRRDFYERKLRGLEQTVGAGTSVDLGAHAYKPRDPRISSLSGHLDEEHFERNYAFLNDMRNAEMELLKKRIAAHKATGKKGQRLRQRLFSKSGSDKQPGIGRHFAGTTLDENVQELKRLQQEKAALERTQVDRNAKRAVKQHVKETSGGKTFYLKRHENKRLHLEAKYEEIRKRGGDSAVDKVLAKRRKKNKSKDAGLLGGGGGGKLAAAGSSTAAGGSEAKRFRY